MRKPASFILISFLLLFISSYAQSPWERLSASPQENNLNQVQKIPNTNKLIAFGDGSTVMISADAGETWELIINPADNSNQYTCKGACFINETTGFLYGGKETILKTTDGGYTWVLKYDGATTHENRCINDITFISETCGFATARNGQLFKTIDIGETWLPIESGVDSYLYQIVFADSLIGFINLMDGQALKTTNGGDSWSLVELISEDELHAVWGFRFISDSIGLLSAYVEENFVIYRSEDKGETWVQVYSDWPATMSDNFVFFDESSGIFACPTFYFGTNILSTEDGGLTWTENPPNMMSNSDAVSVCAFDDNTLISVGYDGRIFKSTNRGIDWEPKYHREFLGDIFDTQVLNENEAYALSYSTGGGVLFHMLMKTINGGITWECIFGGDALHFLNSDTGYVVEYDINTAVYKTLNGGNNWIELETGFDIEPEVIRFYDYNNGIIADNNNNMIRTSDGGATWELITTAGVGWCKDIEYRTADLVFAVGTGNSGIAKSTDGGLNWEMIYIDDFYGAEDIFFLNDDTVFLTAYDYILKSTDGGDTWIPTNVNTSNSISFRSIHFPTPEIGYAVGDGDYENMFKTTDGGENWNPIVTHVSSDLNYVYFSEKDNGLAFGDGGVLIKTTTGGVVAIEEQANIAKNSFFDVFPNPTSDIINIQFNSSKKHKNAAVLVKDAMGKTLEIYILENSQGIIRLSMESYSSGIYFLQYISSEGVVEVKKVIVE